MVYRQKPDMGTSLRHGVRPGIVRRIRAHGQSLTTPTAKDPTMPEHLVFLGKSNPPDSDRRWMDWRVVDWVTSGQFNLPQLSALTTEIFQ